MRRILLSLASVAFVGALVAGGTGAFFSDTETSTGNTFTAGALDLKVDSQAHYNGMVCVPDNDNDGSRTWQAGFGFPGGNETVPADWYPQPGTPCDGTWTETDLGVSHKFFNLTDIKPGDYGENTISLHVYDNDAWGRFAVRNVVDADIDCTEPELEAEPGCEGDDIGELGQSISFYAWLDQGATPGFQNGNPGPEPILDSTEGDNIWQCEQFQNSIANFLVAEDKTINPAQCAEPLVILPGTVNPSNTNYNIWPALSAAYGAYCNGQNEQGQNGYGICHGLALDGRMVGSTTYYFGLAWSVPTTVGNEAQTDSLEADLVFEVVQHRHNPTPQF